MKNFYQAGRAMSLKQVKKVLVVLLSLYFGIGVPALGQELTVGDTLPAEFWNTQVEIYSKQAGAQTLKLSMLKGKAFVLDFLSTGCVSCVQALPRIQAIQKQYADLLEVLPITSERLERVQSFANSNAIMKTIDLPVIYQDRELKSWFPHQYISHLVWIDADGVVKAITGASQFQEFTMVDFLNGNTTDWPFKTERTDFFKAPMLAFTAGTDQLLHNSRRVLNYAMLTGYTEGIGGYQPSSADTLQGIKRISFRNRTLLELYLIAVDRQYKLKEDQIQVMLPNREGIDYRFADFSAITVDAWMRNHGVCYERTIAANTLEVDWKDLMLQDLNHFLNLKGTLILQDGKEVFRLETN